MTKKLSETNPGCTNPADTLRSGCPIACALDILGDRWSLIVIRDMFFGSKTYSDFLHGMEKIPTNILADRLKRLEAVGLIEKEPYQARPVRYSYHLTKRGRDLGPTLAELAKWGARHLKYDGKWETVTKNMEMVKKAFLDNA